MWTAGSDPNSFLRKMSLADRWGWVFAKIGREYLIKLVVAILLTPVVYAVHEGIVKVLRIAPEKHEARARKQS